MKNGDYQRGETQRGVEGAFSEGEPKKKWKWERPGRSIELKLKLVLEELLLDLLLMIVLWLPVVHAQARA